MTNLQTVDRFSSIFLMEANAWSAASNTNNTKKVTSTRDLNIPTYHVSCTGFKFPVKKVHVPIPIQYWKKVCIININKCDLFLYRSGFSHWR